MSCEYPIRFAPDALGDFVDELIVQTQDSPDLHIQLIGARRPPCLRSSFFLNYFSVFSLSNLEI